MSKQEYDVFISYNSNDRFEVEELAKRLCNKYRIKVWFDSWELRPGTNWIDFLEEAIYKSKSVIVCIGNSGLGPWQDKEIKNVIIKFSRSKRIVPVLLASAKRNKELPFYLADLTSVDYRNTSHIKTDEKLIWGLKNKRPDFKSEEINGDEPDIYNSLLSRFSKLTQNVLTLKKPISDLFSIIKNIEFRHENNYFEEKPPIDILDSYNSFIYKKHDLNEHKEVSIMTTIQSQIDKTKKGCILEIPFGEFHESLVIKNPLTIKGSRKSITIAAKSPTVSINSKNVILDNVIIVNTDDNGVCLSVKKGCAPQFKDVFIKGRVEGLEGEEGQWEVPGYLELAIIPDKSTINRFTIYSPVEAKIYPLHIEVITCTPQNIKPGLNDIKIKTKEIREGSLISGELIIETVKNKLKRRIALNGHTLNVNDDTSLLNGKVLWVCESGRINTKFLDTLPEAQQDEPYEFFLDPVKLKCQGFNISVNGLPEGLKFLPSVVLPKIEGVPKKSGVISLKFRFKKDNRELEHVCKLTIKEKVIIPLKIKKLPYLFFAKEDERVNIKFEIISSNSPQITYKLMSTLPDGLSFEESTGEVKGSVSKHGKYKIDIKLADGSNELLQSINLHVLPKKDLRIQLEPFYKVFKNNEFNIPIVVDDAKTILPKIRLKNPPTQISFDPVQNHIKGTLTEAKDYSFEIEVEDTYKRIFTDKIHLKCTVKPSYTIKWSPLDPIEIPGEWKNKYEVLIRAIVYEKINEKEVKNTKVKLKYSCVDNLPDQIKLSQDGYLSGQIDGKKHSLKIRVEAEDYEGEKVFNIITHVKKASRIITPNEKTSKLFSSNKKQELTPEYTLKTNLKPGYVDSPYQDSIFISTKNSEQISMNITDLPDGLRFNKHQWFNKYQWVVEGIPKKEGTYTINIEDLTKGISSTITIRINKSLFAQNNKRKKRDEDVEKKEHLGTAFKSYKSPESKNYEKVEKVHSEPKKETKLGNAFTNGKK